MKRELMGHRFPSGLVESLLEPLLASEQLVLVSAPDWPLLSAKALEPQESHRHRLVNSAPVAQLQLPEQHSLAEGQTAATVSM